MPPDPDLEARLERWTSAGLITPEQADRIGLFAANEAPPHGKLTPGTEAISYLGVVLALAAMFATWGQLETRDGARLVLTGLTTLGLAGAGWILARSPDGSLARLGAILWLLATGTVAFATVDAYLLAGDPDLPEVVPLAVGVAMAVVGWTSYAIRQQAISHVAAFAGTATTAVGMALWLAGEDEPGAIGASLLALGIAWLFAARVMVAPAAGITLAAGAVAVAPTFFAEAATGPALLLGIVLGATTTVVGLRGAGWGGLAIGGVALFGYTTAAIVHFFGETIGAPLALLSGGVLLLGVAIAVSRLRRPQGGGSAPSA